MDVRSGLTLCKCYIPDFALWTQPQSQPDGKHWGGEGGACQRQPDLRIKMEFFDLTSIHINQTCLIFHGPNLTSSYHSSVFNSLIRLSTEISVLFLENQLQRFLRRNPFHGSRV